MADVIGAIENLLRPKAKRGFAGIWTDDHEFVEAARKTRESGVEGFEAISPFPVHGIDEAMNIPRSFIPWACFIFGLTGFTFGVWFTWWVSAVDWPLIIGGKPMWSLPAFIPVIFECTILLGALGSVGTMLFINGLPKIDPAIIDPDLSSHKFAIFVPEDAKGYDAGKLEQLFKSAGAESTKATEF